MVAKITTPASLSRALNYNEKKVQKGQATCLFAGNFLKDAGELNFYEKLRRFQALNELNTRARTNTLHISLNFDPKENISTEKLSSIASVYMEKIGFGEQPFLVYEHLDAGHPHIHIVTTSIRENGRRIDTYNIGRNQSEKARKEIEVMYGLVQASQKKHQRDAAIQPLQVQKIKYGAAETKRSISNVLSVVVNQYCYTSLAELNAVLQLYNVYADEGRREGKLYTSRGLVYRILDEKGNKVGVPITSSSIYFKPTLALLQKKFEENLLKRPAFRSKIKLSLDWALSQKPASLEVLTQQLGKDKIAVVRRENKDGFLYGITFVDHRTKSVFNGSAIGKQYSAAYLQQRLSGNAASGNEVQATSPKPEPVLQTATPALLQTTTKDTVDGKATTDVLQLLLQKEWIDPRLPYGLYKKKKKRKKPGL
jgi:hypothetical protein